MGDIYHAGEVYAGSVPIDDTQASEDKVYSSDKVETMIGEVEQRLDTVESGTITKVNNVSTLYTRLLNKKAGFVKIFCTFTIDNAVSANGTIMTLSDGFRPSGTRYIAAIGNDAVRALQIDTSGNVKTIESMAAKTYTIDSIYIL